METSRLIGVANRRHFVILENVFRLGQLLLGVFTLPSVDIGFDLFVGHQFLDL